jgi:type VII secretion protein EccB
MTMQSRRDLYQAHRLMTRRAALALLRGEPDVPDQPLRRLNVAAFSGILAAVIVTVLFFMWGLLGHSGSALQNQPGTLFIDKQTGQNYVFCDNGKLCPVLNYASARLALRPGASLNQQTVSPSAIAKFPQGPEIGIQGLPPLPDPSLLVRQPWSICTAQETAAGVALHPVTTLSGGIQTGGQPLGTGALLVKALDQDQDWVIWDAERMPIQPAFIAALTNQTPDTVPVVWLNSLPQGPAFAPPAIAGRLDRVASPAGGSARVGQVYAVSAAGSTQYYVLLQGGRLASVTQTQARLLENEPSAPQQKTLIASQTSGHLSSPLPGGALLPSSVPKVAAPAPTDPLCVVYSGGGSSLTRQVATGGQLPTGGVTTGMPGDVDQVALPPERGALVAAAPGTQPDSGVISYFLVADGRRYALASTSVAGMLGYSLSQAVQLPAGVVRLIPQGPILNPAAASDPVPSGG